jgi:hypothetical protein
MLTPRSQWIRQSQINFEQPTTARATPFSEQIQELNRHPLSLFRFIVTSFAVQFVTQKLVTTGFSLHPGAANQRWIMAHMLAVAAGKYRQPIPILTLLKRNDFLFHFFTCAPSP